MLINSLAPPHDQLSAGHFHKTYRIFQKREPTGGSTKHPGKVVYIENFLTCHNQICNARNEVQCDSKSFLHFYNVRRLQTRAGLPTANSICESWIEHTMLKADGAT